MKTYLKFLEWSRDQRDPGFCSDDTARFMYSLFELVRDKYGKDAIIQADNSYYFKS